MTSVLADWLCATSRLSGTDPAFLSDGGTNLSLLPAAMTWIHHGISAVIIAALRRSMEPHLTPDDEMDNVDFPESIPQASPLNVRA